MLTRRKTSDAVAQALLARILDGSLKSGDRIDLDQIADELGVSRSPVREALIQLERDGVVQMPFHRGAFVAPITVAMLREGFTLYALLSAVTSAEFAVRKPAEMAHLESVYRQAEQASDPDEFERHAREFRRIVNVAVAGPHLKALLRTFHGLIHEVSKLAIQMDLEAEKRLLALEFDALSRSQDQQAMMATVTHVMATGERAMEALRARGVFREDEESRDLPAVIPALRIMNLLSDVRS